MKKRESEADWKDIVEKFTDMCREFEHLTELEREVIKKKETFKRVVAGAQGFEHTKQENFLSLFGESNNIYDAQNCYESLPNIEPSINHLIKAIDAEAKASNAKLMKCAEAVLNNKKEYLQIYFGIRYEDPWSPKQLYQVHQLLLILLKCTKKYNREILNNMVEASFGRFRNEDDNSYREPMLFIRRELLKGLSFIDASAIEYFVGTHRNFINTYFQALVERVVEEIPCAIPKIATEIRNDLSTMVLMKFKELNKIKHPVFEEPDDLFWRAYLHFVFLSVEDNIEEPYLNTSNFLYNKNPISPLFLLDPNLIKSNTTIWIAKNSGQRTENDVATVQFDNTIYSVQDFVSGNADIIAMHLWGKANGRLINKHSKDYCKLAKLYIHHNMRCLSEPISLSELMNIINLFEEYQNKLIKSPKRYNLKSTTRKEKTLKSILRNIKNDVSQDSMLKDEESDWHAIVGFLNTLNFSRAYVSKETVKKNNEIRKEIFTYLKSVVPILADESHKDKSITKIAESILNADTLRDYCEWKAQEILKRLKRSEEIIELVGQASKETP